MKTQLAYKLAPLPNKEKNFIFKNLTQIIEGENFCSGAVNRKINGKTQVLSGDHRIISAMKAGRATNQPK
jgi:hypothetical protein